MCSCDSCFAIINVMLCSKFVIGTNATDPRDEDMARIEYKLPISGDNERKSSEVTGVTKEKERKSRLHDHRRVFAQVVR